MRIEKVLVTPELAKEMLENNYSKNRKIKPSDVAKYVEDINVGKWNENVPSPLCISEKGDILNGQHRLHAIVESGKSINCFIAYDVTEDTFPFYDLGSSRTASDVYGGKYSRLKTSIARQIYSLENSDTKIRSIMQSKMDSITTVTLNETIEATKKYDSILSDISKKVYLVKERTRVGSSKGIGFLMWMHYKLNDSRFDEFIESFNGDNISIAAMGTANKLLLTVKTKKLNNPFITAVILEKGYRIYKGEVSSFSQKESLIEEILTKYVEQIRNENNQVRISDVKYSE